MASVPRTPTAGSRGRPARTTRAEVSRRALELFHDRGFEATTLGDVAASLDVGRRTLFRYFPSKNDMVWGDFDWVLDRLRKALGDCGDDGETMTTLADAVVASNRYGEQALAELRVRMTLITTVPALQAHSMLRYAEWRTVVTEYVAERRGQAPDDLVPLTVGHMALAASMAAFTRWVAHPEEDLEAHLRTGYARLTRAFDPQDR